jgi:hypothetical protein
VTRVTWEASLPQPALGSDRGFPLEGRQFARRCSSSQEAAVVYGAELDHWTQMEW